MFTDNILTTIVYALIIIIFAVIFATYRKNQ